MTEVPDRSSARPLTVAVMFMGALIGGIGLLGVVAPLALLDLGRSLLSPKGLCGVALTRILAGLLLLWAAPLSRMPRVLRVIGAVILINGALTSFVGVERSEALLNWFSNQGPMFVRFVAMLAIVFGAFLVHGMIPRRHVV
jgi:hypothetical protein